MIRNPLQASRLWPFAVVPLLLMILSRFFLHMAGSFPDDPDYSYLLNGLEVLTFYPPSYISHPGAPLIMLTALVNLATWLITLPFHRTGLVTDVLSRPEFYLGVNNALLVMALAAAAFWFGDRMRRITGSLPAALAGQFSLLLSFPVMTALNRLEPEPLLLAVTLVLVGLLSPLAFGQAVNARRTATLTGILLGFLIATKITALPLFPLLLLLPDWKLRRRAAWIAGASTIVFTLPQAHHYGTILSWFTGMATHSGAYTAGPAGLPPVATLIANAWGLWQSAPEFFAGLAAYAGLALLGPRPLRRLMMVSALVMAAQILMVVKQPVPRYLVPTVAVLALANAGIVAAFLAQRALPGVVALAALMLAGFCHNAVLSKAWARTSRAVEMANRKVMQQVSASGCAVVLYYEAPLTIYNLDFGNQYAGSRFRQTLQRLYPKGFTYDLARHSFGLFGMPLTFAEVKARLAPARCIYLVGSHRERFGEDFPIPANQLTLVTQAQFDNDRAMAVYRYHP